MRTGVKVLDAMTRKPVFIDVGTSVVGCAKKMSQRGVGSILVKRGRELVGIVTEKDFLKKVVAQGRDGKKLRVENIMSKRMVTIEPDEDLYDAVVLMRDEKVRRLPVMHNGQLVGMLTLNDLLKIEPQLFDYMVEKLQVTNKPFFKELRRGACEQCGHMARLFPVGDSLLCRVCRD